MSSQTTYENLNTSNQTIHQMQKPPLRYGIPTVMAFEGKGFIASNPSEKRLAG
tara:strand:+ start:4572 stop:4730 length:159 start_codon:yes stop_codon:yes gene_type:complete